MKHTLRGVAFRLLIAAPSVLFYAASLMLPAFRVTETFTDDDFGFVLVLFGWVTVFAYPSWLANPLLVCCWSALLWGKPKIALVIGTATTLLAASFLRVESILVNEAGTESPILALGSGYWLWLAACAWSVLAALIILVFQRPAAAIDGVTPAAPPGGGPPAA